MATLPTRLTRLLDIEHPILSAPMAFAGGGALAAAVSHAGGLGLIGGGYGDRGWIEAQFGAAGNARIGLGFITWALGGRGDLLAAMLEHRPAAIMLSFGDPAPHAAAIRAAGAHLICQCQNLTHVRQALDAGAAVIVAQGSEAGGHGAGRGTLTFVAETADLLAAQSPQTCLVAAGGIADGRGLAASLLLGADGVLIGTRLWAAREALVHPRHHEALLAASGDDTIRTNVVDIARQLPWPAGFSARVHNNRFVQTWQGRESELAERVATEGPRYREAFAQGDPDNTGVWFGEAAGLIDNIEPAADIIRRMVGQAADLLRQAPARLGDTKPAQ